MTPPASLASLLAAVALLACSSSSTTPGSAEGADSRAAVGADSIAARFAWRAGEFELHTSNRSVLADGTVTETTSKRQRMIVREDAGHLVVTFPDQPEPGADGFDTALANAYGLLRLELRADGQIETIAGFDAFVDAVADKPGVEVSRADLEAMRPVIEGTFEQDYVLWVVTWLDLGTLPKPGTASERRERGVLVRSGADAGLGPHAGLVRARFSMEGPVERITQTPTRAQLLFGELIAGKMESHFATAKGYWQVEVVTDPNTLVPVVATIETRLTAEADGATLIATASETTEFVPVTH